MDSVFDHLDQDEIHTGILVDYGLPFTQIEKFSGTLCSDNQTDPLAFRMIFASLLSATINPASQLRHLADWNTTADSLQTVGDHDEVLHLGGLYAHYQAIRKDASRPTVAHRHQ